MEREYNARVTNDDNNDGATGTAPAVPVQMAEVRWSGGEPAPRPMPGAGAGGIGGGTVGGTGGSSDSDSSNARGRKQTFGFEEAVSGRQTVSPVWVRFWISDAYIFWTCPNFSGGTSVVIIASSSCTWSALSPT